MSIRPSRASLTLITDSMNKEFPGRDYSIEVAYGQPRLVRKGESINVSPRLRTGLLYEWINAYRDGMRDARDLPPA